MQNGPTEQVTHDRLDPARIAALWATLGREGPPPESGDPLPPFAHQIYFWEPRAPDDLGPDGHPKLGGTVPDLGLPRRMWAGGRLAFHAPLLAGVRAERRTSLRGITRKTGRSGEMAFVTLRHDIRQRGALVLTEDQDIVYLAHDFTARETPQAPRDQEAGMPTIFESVLLFRYSALTFNGHRIHYDADYARSEGYDGLVVHGPLLAQCLAMMAADQLGPLRGFSFRATAPLFAREPAMLCRRGPSLWVRGPEGRLCMTAEVSV